MNYKFKLSTLILYFLSFSSMLQAAEMTISSVIDVEGYACMGDDKSKKQTEQLALADAKREAAEAALTLVKSETKVQDAALQKDVVAAFSNAQVKTIRELDKGWYKDASSGDCYKIKIRAEVKPDLKTFSLTDVHGASRNTMIDSTWHRYEGRKLHIWGDRGYASKIVVQSDGWRVIGTTPENKDELEWGWEITLSIPSMAAHRRFLEFEPIEYSLLDDDGFILITDRLDLAGYENTVLDLDRDPPTVNLFQEIGTTRTYRQTSKINNQKALRAKSSKYIISVN